MTGTLSQATSEPETLAAGQVRIREWRDQDSAEFKTEIRLGLGFVGQATFNLSNPTGPRWWSDKRMAGFEIEHFGRQIEQLDAWPPPWPHLLFNWTSRPDRPLVIKLEHKRVHRQNRPEFYAEIRLPDMLDETPIVEPATFQGVTAAISPAEILALQAAANLVYLATSGEWAGKRGRRRESGVMVDVSAEQLQRDYRRTRRKLKHPPSEAEMGEQYHVGERTLRRHLRTLGLSWPPC